jgi:hypothetical protein
MADPQLQIIVGANVQQAIASIQNLERSATDLEKELNALGTAIDHAIDSGKTDAEIAHLEDAYTALQAKIKALRAESAVPIPAPPMPAPNDSPLLGSLAKQRVAFLDLGRIVTGQGFSLRSLASNFALLGPGITIAAAAIYGLVELFSKQSDAEKKADEDAKKLQETLINLKTATDVTEASTGSEAGNIARVQALAAAITDSTKSYKERKNALDELRETNKAYFGDLTLETLSYADLTDRINKYSTALITEAIVKGQVEEIAKVSSELEKQVDVLGKLKDARDRATATAQSNIDNSTQHTSLSSVGGAVANITSPDEDINVAKASRAFKDQQEVVDKLSTSIASYKGALQQTIALQIQQKPLEVPPKTADDLKSIIPILEQIQRIYAEIAKPSKEPLFKQLSDSVDLNSINVIKAQISEAIKNGVTKGATDPEIKNAYDNLVTALQAKLDHLRSPNLLSSINYTLADPTKGDSSLKLESAIEKAVGSKGLQIEVPVHIKELLDNNGSFNKDDISKIEQGFKDAPGLAHLYEVAVPSVQISIGKFLIKQEDLKKLKETIENTLTGTAVSGFADIGKAIGDALAGSKNPLQSAVKNFTQVLGDGLVKIGEAMIEASTIITALKSALGSLFANPAGGIVVGIATVALGELVKTVGAKAFATGGIVTGPTLGLIGEAGPEVVFPLNRLNDFIGSQPGRGGDTNVNVTGRIAGQDLILINQRAQKNANIVGRASS